MSKKVIISLIISLVLLLGLVAGMFFFYTTSSPNYEKNDISNPFLSTNVTVNTSNMIVKQDIIINEDHITYLLNEMGAYNLKSYLGNPPKIEVQVSQEIFNSEIKEGVITTRKGEIDDEDIRIITSKEELIKIATSQNTKEYIKQSVSSGNTKVEMVAGYSELFAKGYLNLYTEITGKSLTGKVIRIFSSQ